MFKKPGIDNVRVLHKRLKWLDVLVARRIKLANGCCEILLYSFPRTIWSFENLFKTSHHHLSPLHNEFSLDTRVKFRNNLKTCWLSSYWMNLDIKLLQIVREHLHRFKIWMKNQGTQHTQQIIWSVKDTLSARLLINKISSFRTSWVQEHRVVLAPLIMVVNNVWCGIQTNDFQVNKSNCEGDVRLLGFDSNCKLASSTNLCCNQNSIFLW